MGIRQTLNKSLLIPIFPLVLVAVVALGLVTYHVATAELEKRIRNLAESSSVLFEDLLWQYDIETLQVLLDEYVMVGAVTAARIQSEEAVEISAGSHEPGAAYFSHSRDLVHSENNSLRQIGRLTMEMSYQRVWDQVLLSIIATLLVASLAVLATTLIIQRLLNERLIRPVLAIASGLDNWSGEWRDFRIDLGRCKNPGKCGEDELDQLVHSIHGMRDQILAADSVIESKDDRLLSAARIANIGYASISVENGKVTECDTAFARMVGYTSVSELQGLIVRTDVLRERIHADDIERALSVRQRLLDEGFAEGVFRVASETGEYRSIRLLYDLSPEREGQGRQVLCVAQDVTEITRLQASLVHAQKVKAIGSLTGGVAHDFNNILAVISGNLELLDEKISDPRARDHIKTSLHAVGLGAELTHQLLAFARKQPLRPEVLDISRLLRKSLSLLRTSVGESIDLEVVSDGGLWRTEVDKAQLEAAILNLVINARDAMPDGGKLTIEVGNARLDRNYAEQHEEVFPGQYVCVAITDTGCGMSMSTISQALEPFFTTKDIGRGVGLGLPMAFGFAKQSGGHLKVYSELNRGTTVKLYLPRIQSSATSSQPARALSDAHRFKDMQVFLVEDNEDLRKTFTLQLEQLGAIVHGASDGRSALELAKAVPHVDLILCDVILPNGMKGPEVVSRLLAVYRNALVIYMSGYTENAIIHQGRLDEGVIMLQKPFSKSDLVAAYSTASENASGSADV